LSSTEKQSGDGDESHLLGLWLTCPKATRLLSYKKGDTEFFQVPEPSRMLTASMILQTPGSAVRQHLGSFHLLTTPVRVLQRHSDHILICSHRNTGIGNVMHLINMGQCIAHPEDPLPTRYSAEHRCDPIWSSVRPNRLRSPGYWQQGSEGSSV
jgi:hypothetical protein